MSKLTRLTVLGSTGSIGKSTLDVVARHPDKYRIVALTAQQQDELLFEQCRQFVPRYAVLLDTAASERLSKRIAAAGLEVEVLCGVAELERVATLPEVDAVMEVYDQKTSLRFIPRRSACLFLRPSAH